MGLFKRLSIKYNDHGKPDKHNRGIVPISTFVSWLFGKFGPAERTAAAWLRDAVWPDGALCCACGRVSHGETLCPSCRLDLQAQGYTFSWDQAEPVPGLVAWGLRPHTGIHRTLIHKLKYGAEARAAEALASLVLPLPETLAFSPDTVVTWVTMPESRYRNRAVDHSRLLAEAIARQLSLPCRQLLARRDRREKSQVSLTGAGRRSNLEGAFAPLEKISFPVLLVDDVRTTGTTLARCADALRSGGAEQVTAITITRAHDGSV